MSKRLSARKALAIAMILIMGMASCLIAGCSSGSSNPDANLTAQAEPGNGAILAGSNYGNAGVQVTASPDASVYVKVKDMAGGTKVGFYVRSGSTAEVRVPSGTCSVQFASGETWYGNSDRFGSKTSYGQDESVTLRDGEVITYKLQRSTNGNFSMDTLDGSKF